MNNYVMYDKNEDQLVQFEPTNDLAAFGYKGGFRVVRQEGSSPVFEYFSSLLTAEQKGFVFVGEL